MTIAHIQLTAARAILMVEVGIEALGSIDANNKIASVRGKFRRAFPSRVKLLIFGNDSHTEVIIKSIIHT